MGWRWDLASLPPPSSLFRSIGRPHDLTSRSAFFETRQKGKKGSPLERGGGPRLSVRIRAFLFRFSVLEPPSTTVAEFHSE